MPICVVVAFPKLAVGTHRSIAKVVHFEFQIDMPWIQLKFLGARIKGKGWLLENFLDIVSDPIKKILNKNFALDQCGMGIRTRQHGCGLAYFA